jgi:hypothetical protein
LSRRLARSFIALSLALGGCSADRLTPPEPGIKHPGAFVAVTDDDGVIVLLRTLRVVTLDSEESIYDAIRYEGIPSSYDEAETWARDRQWPVADDHVSLPFSLILSHDPEVVWFRTLTEEERLAALLD